jgi:hypothetical protein
MSNQSSGPKKGLKINNQASTVQKPAPKVSEEFEVKAKEAFKRNEGYKERLTDLSVRFKSMVEDTTLVENKTMLQRDLEKDLANKIIELAVDLDTDDDQKYGEGSRAFAFLLLKFMLIQRDRINTLSYKLYNVEKKLVEKEKSSQDIAQK